jgi:ATP adenylyltransferase
LAEHRLWAPWRLEYIKSNKEGECIFCARLAEGDDESSLIVHRGERCFVILNAYPYNNGHVMVAPYQHTASLESLDYETSCEIMALSQRSLRALAHAYGPDGYNLGINLGAVAGAGVEDHVHLHVVPRWKGDTNFMSALGNTRVLPERLEDGYRNLRAAFGALEEGEA